MKRIWLSLVAAGLLAIAAFAPVSAQDAITLDLEEVDGSGVAGNVRIESQDGEATVTILLTQGLEDESTHPVHIHEGTCEDLGDVAYPLNNIEDGSSETTLDVDLADLRTGSFAINAHESEENIQNYIACANIPASVGGDVQDEDADNGEDAGEDDQADENGEDQTADEGEDGGETEDDAAGENGEDAGDGAEDDGQAEDDAADENGDGADDGEAEDDAADENGDGTDDGEAEDDAAEDEEAEDAADQTDEDEEAADDGEDEAEEEQEAVVPATGSTGGTDADTAAMTLLLLAGTGLGAGVLLRRRAAQPQRS